MGVDSSRYNVVEPHANSRIVFFGDADESDYCLGCNGECDCSVCEIKRKRHGPKQIHRNHQDVVCEES